MSYKLTFRLREDRAGADGRAPVFGDLLWKLGRRGSGSARINGFVTNVACSPVNWMPKRATAALAAGRRPLTYTHEIHHTEPHALSLNFQLDHLKATISEVFLRAQSERRIPSREEVLDALALAGTSTMVQARVSGSPGAKTTATGRNATGIAHHSLPEAPYSSTRDRAHLPMRQLYEQWRQENEGLRSKEYLRSPAQVVTKLEEFLPGITVADITRPWLATYIRFLFAEDKVESTVNHHIKWLRRAFEFAELKPPAWLEMRKVRKHPRPRLLPSEFLQLLRAELPVRMLADERDRFIVQTLLCLRDSDMRFLQPAHLKQLPMRGSGLSPVLDLRQVKTTDAVASPIPPLAWEIVQRHGGSLTAISNDKRNEFIKRAAFAAGLTRLVSVTRFQGDKRTDSQVQLCDVISTHSARHTGAMLVMLGSGGDRNLKEIALGHTNDVYGVEDIFEYGPRLLAAWARALTLSETDRASADQLADEQPVDEEPTE